MTEIDDRRIYYKIGEVAELLSEEVSCIRYWADSLPNVIRTTRTSKNNRQFKPADVRRLAQVRHMVREQGLTLDGVRQRFDNDDGTLDSRMEAISRLERVRDALRNIRDAL